MLTSPEFKQHQWFDGPLVDVLAEANRRKPKSVQVKQGVDPKGTFKVYGVVGGSSILLSVDEDTSKGRTVALIRF